MVTEKLGRLKPYPGSLLRYFPCNSVSFDPASCFLPPAHMRRWAFALTLLALACRVFPVPHEGGTKFLPYCNAVAHMSSQPHHEQLRDLLQLLIYWDLRVSNLHELRSNNEPSIWAELNPELQFAFKTPRTNPELDKDLTAAHQAAQQTGGKIDELIRQLQANGHLAQNATRTYLVECLSGPLNPRLYPGRPQVSFLMQVWPKLIMLRSQEAA